MNLIDLADIHAAAAGLASDGGADPIPAEVFAALVRERENCKQRMLERAQRRMPDPARISKGPPPSLLARVGRY